MGSWENSIRAGNRVGKVKAGARARDGMARIDGRIDLGAVCSPEEV